TALRTFRHDRRRRRVQLNFILRPCSGFDRSYARWRRAARGIMAGARLASLDTAREARAYHDPRRSGCFSILFDVAGATRQSSHRLIEMPTVLGLVDKTRDTWLTQAEFIRPNRRVVSLARVGLLFADLDTYRQPWATGRT